ncbi:MAG: hypothetical protein ACSW8A_00460 [Lachnospiraceae bacterium]
MTLPIFIGIVAACAAGLLLSRLPGQIRFRILIAMAVFFVGSEVIKQFLLAGIFADQPLRRLWYIPFQLCSMPIYLLPVGLMLCSKQSWVGHSNGLAGNRASISSSRPGLADTIFCFLADYGLLAGIFTFFDTTGLHYPLKLLTIHSFSWHYLMIIMAFLCHAQLRDRTLTNSVDNHGIAPASQGSAPDFRGQVLLFLGSTLLFLVCVVIAQLINYLLHPYGELNMFYISFWEPIYQAVFCDIAGVIGDPLTHLLYLACIILGAGVVHAVLHSSQDYPRVCGE